jgi:hypothetical protein
MVLFVHSLLSVYICSADRTWKVSPTFLYADNVNFCLKIGDAGLNIMTKFGSYSSFLESLSRFEKLSQIKKKSEKNIKTILSVISTGGVIWGATFTYLNYDKNELVLQKDRVILQQQTETDSLRQTLIGQQNAIDSLAIILTAYKDTIK